MQKKIIIHFVLSSEDEDLIRWKEALPKRTFNKYVNEILFLYSAGKFAVIPYALSTSENLKPVNGRIVVTNPDIINTVKKMKKGHITEEIKAIIRNNIRFNSEHPKKADLISCERIFNVFDDFKSKITLKEKETFGVPDKYRKLCLFYELALKSLYSEILDCMNADRRAIANSKLLHIDCEKIINDSFDTAFAVKETETKITYKESIKNEI